MAWNEAVSALKRGSPTDFFNYLWVDEKTIAASNRADRQLTKLNFLDMLDGKLAADEFRRRTNAIDKNAFPTAENPDGGLFRQPGTSPWDGFKSGLAAGPGLIVDNVLASQRWLANLANRLVGGTVANVIRALPWWLWALILVGLTIYVLSLVTKLKKAA